MLRLKKMRTGKQELPQVYVADMREELKHRNRSILSDRLIEMMQDRLDKKRTDHAFPEPKEGDMSDLYLAAPVVKWYGVLTDVLFGTSGWMLGCHYCGYQTLNSSEHCPSCGFADIGDFRAGTQQIEEMGETHFPGSNGFLRMDYDTPGTK